jgi:hypothetical protein
VEAFLLPGTVAGFVARGDPPTSILGDLVNTISLRENLLSSAQYGTGTLNSKKKMCKTWTPVTSAGNLPAFVKQPEEKVRRRLGIEVFD